MPKPARIAKVTRTACSGSDTMPLTTITALSIQKITGLPLQVLYVRSGACAFWDEVLRMLNTPAVARKKNVYSIIPVRAINSALKDLCGCPKLAEI